METDAKKHNRMPPLAPWLARQTAPLWIVGGALRDALAGRAVRDLDLVAPGDALALARDLARSTHGHLAVLDSQAGVARVVWDDLPLAVDVAALQGDDIDADLRARDLTINALALPLTQANLAALLAGDVGTFAPHLRDPFGGQADLAARVARVVTPASFQDDPLRVLRAARLASGLDLTLAPESVALAREVAPALMTLPPARLTAELYAMLAGPRPTRAMRLLDDLGALTVLVPPLDPCRGVIQGRLHHWDVFDHTLEVLDSLDRVVALLAAGLMTPEAPSLPDEKGRVAHPVALDLGGHNAALLALLREPLAEGQTRLTALKVATLFHDVGKPFTRTTGPEGDYRFPGHPDAAVPLTEPVLAAWQAGKTLRRFVTTSVAMHMRPGQLAGPQGISDHAIRHFFRDAGATGLDVAIFSIADHLAVYGPTPLTPFWIKHRAAVAELVRRAYDEPERVWPARLIDGNDLIARFGVPRGPEIRRILADVQVAQWDGTIATRAEALALAARLAQGDALAQATTTPSNHEK